MINLCRKELINLVEEYIRVIKSNIGTIFVYREDNVDDISQLFDGFEGELGLIAFISEHFFYLDVSVCDEDVFILIEEYDKHMTELIENGVFNENFRPLTIRQFFEGEMQLLRYMDELSDRHSGPLNCDMYLDKHFGCTTNPDFCICCPHIDNCSGELPYKIIKDMVKKHKNLLIMPYEF